MTVEAHTVQPPPTGAVIGEWREKYGSQKVTVRVDPRRSTESEFSVDLDRRWGPQGSDTRRVDFRMSRVGAETIRDALTAALEWTPPSNGEESA